LYILCDIEVCNLYWSLTASAEAFIFFSQNTLNKSYRKLIIQVEEYKLNT
jgi:hypothetical protein